MLESSNIANRLILSGSNPSELPIQKEVNGRIYTLHTKKLSLPQRAVLLIQYIACHIFYLVLSASTKESLPIWWKEIKTGVRLDWKRGALKKPVKEEDSRSVEQPKRVVESPTMVERPKLGGENPAIVERPTLLENPIIVEKPSEPTLSSQPTLISTTSSISENQLQQVKDLGPLTAANFSAHAQLVLEHFYKKPMPEKADVTVPHPLTNEMVKWSSLTKADQKLVITKNKKGSNTNLFGSSGVPSFCKDFLFRGLHGCLHVERAAIEVRLLAQLYKKWDPTFKISDEDLLIALYLTIFHDSARQAEGVDVWDDISANNAGAYLKAMGFAEDKVNTIIENFKNKVITDAERDPITSLVHDADSLDIMRVYGLGAFKNKYLDIFNKLEKVSGFAVELESVKKEISEFIQFTEKLLTKAYLEVQSTDYARDLLSLVTLKQGKVNRFPLMLAMLTEQMGSLPKTSKKIKWIANSLHQPKEKGLSLVQSLKALGKAGVNPSYILADEKGKLFFWKKSQEIVVFAEEAGSRMSSLITGGLVPVAKAEKFTPLIAGSANLGTLQPFVELSKGPFAPKNHVNKTFDPSKLSLKQREQLFVHMIADRSISNYDGHTGNFGIDLEGNVIGFDKGQAYKFFEDKALTHFPIPEPAEFDPKFTWHPLGLDRTVYPAFAEFLKKNPAEAARIWNSLTVREAFQRCQSLTKEQITAWLMPYAKVCFKGTEESFYAKVHARVLSLEGQMKKYFAV